MKVDLILKNGKFYQNGDYLCGSLAVSDGKIKDIATTGEIENKYESNRVIDLEWEPVFPGFIDSHIHLVQTGFLKIHIDLSTASSIQELTSMIEQDAQSKSPGEWIIGSSFDDNKFSDDRFPTKHDLDKVAPDNPVFIIRVCTHLMVANSKALELAGINADTENPQGSEIIRENNGEPNGILKRNAGDLVYSIIYDDTDMIKRAIKASIKYLNANGITAAHSMAIGVKNSEHYFNILKSYKEALKEENYSVRVCLGTEHELLEKLIEHDMTYLSGNEYFKQGYIKFFTDGSYGSRSALLYQPYADDPTNYGIEATPKAQLYKYAKMAHDNGYQCAIHALGDRALANALDVLEKVIDGEDNYLRHRIVHAGISPDHLIERIKHSDILVDVQPNFIASEAKWLSTALGNRVHDTYKWKTMYQAGINLAASSDSPVEPVNPFYGIRAAITRKSLDNYPEHGFNAEERLDLKTAINMYTINGAYQYFDEQSMGSIEPDKYADLVVLTDDPFTINVHNLVDIETKMTFVGGELVFEKD